MGKEQDSSIGIVTDTSALYSPDKGGQLRVQRVPLITQFGTESFSDSELTPSSFAQKLNETGVHPKSSGAPPGKFLEAYQSVPPNRQKIFSIHLPGFASTTLNSAKLAAQQFEEESGVEVEVIDARQLLAALGFIVMEAARLANRGASENPIRERIETLRKRCLTVVAGLDLDYVEEGGRIPKPIMVILRRGTDFLKIIPMISIREAKGAFDLRPILPLPRTEDQVFKKFLDLARKENEKGGIRKIAVMHFRAEERAQRLQQELGLLLGTSIPVFEAPSSIGVHSGLGAFGLAILK